MKYLSLAVNVTVALLFALSTVKSEAFHTGSTTSTISALPDLSGSFIPIVIICASFLLLLPSVTVPAGNVTLIVPLKFLNGSSYSDCSNPVTINLYLSPILYLVPFLVS